EEDWLKDLRVSAGSDSRRWRMLVLAALALDRPTLARESIAEQIRVRPGDPLPHIARLFVGGRPVPAPPSSAAGTSHPTTAGRPGIPGDSRQPPMADRPSARSPQRVDVWAGQRAPLRDGRCR